MVRALLEWKVALAILPSPLAYAGRSRPPTSPSRRESARYGPHSVGPNCYCPFGDYSSDVSRILLLRKIVCRRVDHGLGLGSLVGQSQPGAQQARHSHLCCLSLVSSPKDRCGCQAAFELGFVVFVWRFPAGVARHPCCSATDYAFGDSVFDL